MLIQFDGGRTPKQLAVCNHAEQHVDLHTHIYIEATFHVSERRKCECLRTSVTIAECV